MISLQENYEKEYKYGLVTEVSQLPDNPSKTYKADWYNLGKVDVDVDTIIKIERTQSGLLVSRIRNGENEEIIRPQLRPKFFSEFQTNTDTNWESFMKRRKSYRQEGPIFLSYTGVRGNKTVLELREELISLVENEIIRWAV